MKYTFLIILICIATLLLTTGNGFAQKVSSDLQNTIHLFNGKDLDGWYTFLKDRGRDNDPKKVFTVKDRVLCISGEEWGCITTDKEFENYKLVVEFKWGDKTYGSKATKARDNGILLHSIGKDGAYDGTWMYSIECNIIEGGTGDLLVVGDQTNRFLITAHALPLKEKGTYLFNPASDPVTVNDDRINWIGRDPDWKNEKDFRGKNDVENPVGEWNRLECIVNGDQMTIYLNGVMVNQAIYVRPNRGRIQIQSEGAETFYRRVDLTPLPATPAYIPEGFKSLFNGKDLTGWTKHGTELWYAKDGEIICESGPDKNYGYLSTKKEYKDYILDVDYKQEENGNSGIFLRSSIDGVAITGWQAEVANPGEHSAGIYESGKGGRGWLVMPEPEKEKVLREGEWNHMRIKVQGSEVTTWLNGIQMVHLDDKKFAAGKGVIALQIHNGGGIKVRWKNLLIREL